jgi:hypothetical protein
VVGAGDNLILSWFPEIFLEGTENYRGIFITDQNKFGLRIFLQLRPAAAPNTGDISASCLTRLSFIATASATIPPKE